MWRLRIRLSLLLVFAWSCLATAQSPSRQALAEEAASRIVHRFYETLDFADVYREFYVSNQNIRKAEVEIIIGNMISKGDHFDRVPETRKRTIDFSAMERAYIALANFNWLAAAAVQTYDGDRKRFEKETQAAWDKYYKPLNDKSTWPILTTSELDERLTARFDGLANVYRRYVVQQNFGTAEFRRMEALIEESQPPDPLDELKKLFAPAGVKQTDNLYVVRTGRFYFYLLDENGEFRMLSYTNRIRS